MEVTCSTRGKNPLCRKGYNHHHHQMFKFPGNKQGPTASVWLKRRVNILVCCLALLVASADNLKLVAFGATLQDEAADGGGGVSIETSPKRRQQQLDWQLERVLGQMFGGEQSQPQQQQQHQRKQQLVRERVTNQPATSEQVVAPNPMASQATAGLLFETIPRPSVRSAPQLTWSAQLLPFSDAHLTERRNLPRLNSRLQLIQGNTLGNALDQLNAIESLNSLLEDDNLSRLGRAYKPKTMSTARGFGKRSYWSPSINWSANNLGWPPT